MPLRSRSWRVIPDSKADLDNMAIQVQNLFKFRKLSWPNGLQCKAKAMTKSSLSWPIHWVAQASLREGSEEGSEEGPRHGFPFQQEKVHISEVAFLDELVEDGKVVPSRPRGAPLLAWKALDMGSARGRSVQPWHLCLQVCPTSSTSERIESR